MSTRDHRARRALLKDLPEGEFMPEDIEEIQLQNIRSSIFETFFKKKHVISVTSQGEQLNRECSLFTDDSRFLIVVSATFISEENHPHYFDIYRNNESVAPTARSPLEDYTLHLVDILSGQHCDKRTFKTDKIFLSHNQGLYLYKSTLAILSVQHQTIHVFRICHDDLLNQGHFTNVKTIGRFCFEDDEFLVSSIRESRRPSAQERQIRAFREASINSLKHRLLVHLYRKASLECDENGSSIRSVRQFYQNFDKYSSLRMWKMQLLDEHNLFIKYANEEVITLRLSDLNSPPSLFMVYNFETTQVIETFQNTSTQLLDLVEKFCDYFRNPSVINESSIISSPQNNIYARQIHVRYKQTIISARNGGQGEAVKRILAILPISAQSFTSSPYLDWSLFSYDDKWISVLERPKACGEYPIRFFARDSGLLRFKIFAGLQSRQQAQSARRLVAFTFHPFDPFAISVQRTNADYVVNLHLRHTS
ncbi:DET1 -like protein [Halotydeus destructor]|nr:DET1 -like protein [Halotydeus destructor]